MSVKKKNPIVLQTKNTRQKNIPARNMPTKISRWYVFIGDSGI
jgi:hypothetical protein